MNISPIKIWDKPLISLAARQQFILPRHIKWEVPQAADGGPASGEALSEFAGRLCYLSFGEGEVDGHASVKGRTVTSEYFANILDTRHGSVLEHAVWSILFEGVSRSFTHELVRHRAGSAEAPAIFQDAAWRVEMDGYVSVTLDHSKV